MKRNILYACACIMVVIMASCANNKIAVSGPVGTKIYDDKYNCLGQIGNDNKVQIKLKENKPILLAVDPKTNKVMPFGIDYKKHDLTIVYIADFIGGGVIAPWSWFTYYDLTHFPGNMGITLNKEQTIGEFNFAEPNFNEFDRDSFVPVAKQRMQSTSNDKQTTSTISSRLLKTPSDVLAGKYQCGGRLTLNEGLIENYDSLMISIDKLTANEVLVNVYDSTGDAFFNEPLKCIAEKQPDGTYILSHSIPGVNITVSPDKKITFVHSAIQIGQDIYKLDAISK